ncbi:hypothetical protein [Psychrobacter sp. LV10R520-6]|uniref:hypothetical protein n=1 Tax=Psychrobacter sp. LV10R520-6 TaxID=1415574 RepID=UPI0024CC0352|nr:hypothetical protein [Psychrobacter sp. LV10R520-6]SNT70558.1 hypothetical protein SAMN04488491_1732 [Psychrobacter sp. LV10R520-6]
MSQIFNLRLATETSAIDAQQLGVTIEQLQRIRVDVSATIIQQPKPYLWLTYQIKLPHPSLAAKLNWPVWEQEQVGFSDYLWEQTCLECFIETGFIAADSSVNNNPVNDSSINDSKAKGYIEVNASPNGRYALYQFNSYRNPSTLPPNPLLRTDGRTRAHIDWNDSTFTPHSHYEHDPCFYERSFGLPLNQLSNQPFAIKPIAIERLHPCVILWFGEIVLYFAPNHASPPDFHQQQYWSRFDYKSALAK